LLLHLLPPREVSLVAGRIRQSGESKIRVELVAALAANGHETSFLLLAGSSVRRAGPINLLQHAESGNDRFEELPCTLSGADSGKVAMCIQMGD
jgi:hypothetical protein